MTIENNTLKNVKKLLVEELNIDSISDSDSQSTIPEWNSLAYMSIVSRVEDEFNIEATEKNIESFDTVMNIVRQIDLCKQ